MIFLKILFLILTLALGFLLHFLYEISGKNKLVARFSAVNESVWEHLKLSFFPILIVGIVEYIVTKGSANNFWLGKLISSLFAMIFTVVCFYTYLGIMGKDNFVIDILIFVGSIIFATLINNKINSIENLNLGSMSIIIMALIIMAFGVFTVNPPKIPLFQDSTTKKYGID